jgi:hypothetical protein
MIGLRWLCWVPLILLGATEVCLRNYDGWGAWASSPLLLGPAVVSFSIVLAGLFECVRELRAGRLSLLAPVYTLIAALPLIWLAVRRYMI